MQVLSPVERTLTQLDYVRLARVLTRAQMDDSERALALDAIEDVLASSEVVTGTAVSPDIVTMYSQVLLADDAGSDPYKLTLCYPEDAQPAAGFISVLSPVGASLLGLRVGGQARWSTPDGNQRSAEIRAVLFQPEASGDYTA